MSFASRFTPKTDTSHSFAAKIEMDTALVYDLRATKDGVTKFYIVRVDKIRHNAYLRIIRQNGGFDLADYGDVLYFGYDEPSEELKIQLRERFGMYENS